MWYLVTDNIYKNLEYGKGSVLDHGGKDGTTGKRPVRENQTCASLFQD